MLASLLYANRTIRLSSTANLIWYVGIWALCIAGLVIVARAALRSPRFARWTTRDLLVVAALAVLLEVYDNVIGDQFIKPIIDPIPGTDLLQVHDLPYMFLLMVGVAVVRKPGCVTAMVFVNYLLAQLLFGTTHGALDWTDGLTQGVFCDLYIVARRGRVCAPNSSRWTLIFDGFAIGALRGGPNSFLTDWVFDPYLNAQFYTVYQMITDTWSNAVGNGLAAGITAPLAMRVARAVVPSLGRSGATSLDEQLAVLDHPLDPTGGRSTGSPPGVPGVAPGRPIGGGA